MSIKAYNVYYIFLAQIFLINFFSFENKESSISTTQRVQTHGQDKTSTTIEHQ